MKSALEPQDVTGKLIATAYENLSHRFHVIAMEMQALNTMLKEASDRAEQITFPKDLVKNVVKFKHAGDDVTLAMVEGSLLLDRLNQAVIYHARKKS